MKRVTYKEIFRFYLPLVLNAQMLFLSSPFINLGLSRTADPELAMAAYSVGFLFMAFLSGPSLASRNISTALIADRASFLFIRRIIVSCGLIITLIAILIAATPPLYHTVFFRVYGIPPTIAREVRRVLLIISPIALILGWRGVHQGVALMYKKPAILAYATLVRLTTLILVVFISVFFLKLPGASGGALGILSGMTIEALFVYLQVRKFLTFASPPERPQNAKNVLRLSDLFHFSYPLVIGMYVLALLPTLVNGIISRTNHPEMALAGFGVMYPLLRFFASPLLGFKSTTLVLYRSYAGLKRLTIAALSISLCFSGLLFAIGYTPIGLYLLTDFFALDAELIAYTYPGLLMMFLFPVFIGVRCHSQGILMNIRATKAISVSAISKVLLLLAVGALLLCLFPGINGVILGIGLVTIAELCDDIILGGVAVNKTRRPGPETS